MTDEATSPQEPQKLARLLSIGTEGQDKVEADGAPPQAEVPALATGTVIDDFEILEEVGRGGMGVVYKAFERSLRRVVALKMLSPALSGNPTLAKRFRREAILAANLTHPGIVPVYNVDKADPPRYFTMEFVQGWSLKDKVQKEGALSPAEAVRIALQACEALEHAHERHIVHRDVKPANILLQNHVERVRITDFGIAQDVTGRLAGKTETEGSSAGTPAFMSPEQNLGRALDKRTDIFSLGMTLYYMLTGEVAYHATNRAELALAFQQQSPTSPSRLNPEVGPDLDRVVLRMIATDPAARYPDCWTVADALTGVAAVTSESGAAKPVVPMASRARRVLRRPYVLVSVLAGVLILVAVAAALLMGRDGWQWNRQPPKPPEGVAPGTVPVVTLAEVMVSKTQAESAWGQVKGLDRGQGVGTALDEAQSLLMQANELYARKALPEAKAAYARLAGLCADLASAELQRRGQDFQKLLTEAKKTADGLPADKEHLSASQKSDAGVALKAIQAALAYKPNDREALALRDKLDSYLGIMTMDLGNGVTLKLALIPAGKFMMGSPDFEEVHASHEVPQHEVVISKPFYMGVTEVTQAQYNEVMGTNNSRFKGPTNPVEVSWESAVEFCRRLSEKTGKIVRLPTEAEWEYACRAGSKTRFSFGDSDSTLGDYAWYGSESENDNKGNSGGKTHPVGQKKPNPWGLYDMHGNLWEWCQDFLGLYAAGAVTDPAGPVSGTTRVLRGGCWNSSPNACRSAGRLDQQGGRQGRFGFRVVVSVSASARPQVPSGEAKLTDLPLDGVKSMTPATVRVPPGFQAVGTAAELYTNTGWAKEIVHEKTGIKMVFIPAGQFMMGSPDQEKGRHNDEVQHLVRISKPFYLGRYEVTRGQFGVFVQAAGFRTGAEKDGWSIGWNGHEWVGIKGISWRNPGFVQTDDHPAVCMSWKDAIAFCAWAGMRLPTEAEWEYACRAGTLGAYPWGDEANSGWGWCNGRGQEAKATFPGWETFGWTDGYVFTSPVGSFRPNAWGLYDMHGNVWKWCADWYGPYASGAAVDPSGPSAEVPLIERGDVSVKTRVQRGGAWDNPPAECRSANRSKERPDWSSTTMGFRVAVDLGD